MLMEKESFEGIGVTRAEPSTDAWEISCARVIGQITELGTGKMPTPVYCSVALHRDPDGFPVAYCHCCGARHRLGASS